MLERIRRLKFKDEVCHILFGLVCQLVDSLMHQVRTWHESTLPPIRLEK